MHAERIGAPGGGLRPPPALGRPADRALPTVPSTSDPGRGPSGATSDLLACWHEFEPRHGDTAGRAPSSGASSPDAEEMTMEDMEMDFATLFDPEREAADMLTLGSGWPQVFAGGGQEAAGAQEEGGVATPPSLEPAVVRSDGNVV